MVQVPSPPPPPTRPFEYKYKSFRRETTTAIRLHSQKNEIAYNVFTMTQFTEPEWWHKVCLALGRDLAAVGLEPVAPSCKIWSAFHKYRPQPRQRGPVE